MKNSSIYTMIFTLMKHPVFINGLIYLKLIFSFILYPLFSIFRLLRKAVRTIFRLLRKAIKPFLQLNSFLTLIELAKSKYAYSLPLLPYAPKNDQLNIVYAIHNSLPETNNGYAIRSHFIAKSAKSADIAINPITRLGFPFDIKKTKELWDGKYSHQHDTITYHKINNHAYFLSKTHPTIYLNQYAYHLQSFAIQSKANIIHAASDFHNALAAINAARSLNIPSIYEVRGFWEITKASRFPGFEKTMMFDAMRTLEIQACQDATSVIALSEIVKEELVNRGIDADKIYIIANGIDTKKLLPSPKHQPTLDKSKWQDEFIIGFIGSVVDYEGLDLLIEAAEKLQDKGYSKLRYLIVGDGNVLQTLIDSVHQKSLSELFIFTGRVPYEEVSALYSVIDIACYPRKNWPVCSIVSPKKPFESMSFGIPIISSSVRANSYFIEHGINGLIHDCEDVTSLMEQIITLYENKDLYTSISKNARDWVIKNRDSERTGLKLKEIYLQTIDRYYSISDN